MKLDRAEQFEIILIGATAVGCWNFALLLPAQLTAGNILLDLSALLLLQGLIRDLWLLAAMSRKPASSPTTLPQAARCMCVESTIGATGVLSGLILLVTGFSSQPITISPAGWGVAVLLALATGFVIKDWLFEFSPFGIRHDPHHVNIIISWNKRQG